MAPRIASHAKETKSRDFIRNILDTDDSLIREWTERDYGIDFLLELFDNGFPTGKLAFLQIKGTEKIEKLKKTDEVSCQVSRSSLFYALQDIIPFVVIYVSISEGIFFYIDLQSIRESFTDKLESDQEKINIRIPFDNCVRDNDILEFMTLINSYY